MNTELQPEPPAGFWLVSWTYSESVLAIYIRHLRAIFTLQVD